MDPLYESRIQELLRDYTDITDLTLIKKILQEMDELDRVYPLYKDPQRKGRLHIGHLLDKVLQRHNIKCQIGVLKTPTVLKEHIRVTRDIFTHLGWKWDLYTRADGATDIMCLPI